jgi:uncharacterized membrane protein
VTRSVNWAAAAVAAVLLAFSFYALVHWLERGQLSDVGGYREHATLIRTGLMPYRDFAFEYPPAALPVMLLPAYLPWSYATSFAVLMWICGAGCIVAAAVALSAVRADAARTWAALLAIGAAPLVLGSLFDTRYDLWPTLLAVGAVAAVVRERPVISGVLLGLGFAAKLWPGVLLPIAVVHLWRRRGERGAVAGLVAFLGAAAVCFLPFVVLAPGGLRDMLADQLGRPLQVESLGAAVLMAAQHLGMRSLTTVTTHGAQALTGRGAGLAAGVSTALEVAAVVAVWIVFARKREATRETVLVAAAAAVAALVAFDKVLSPQYLIWLVPVVALVGGRSGLAAAALFGAALVTTHLWFPMRYWDLVGLEPVGWLALVRNILLVALAVVLATVTARGPAEPRNE